MPIADRILPKLPTYALEMLGQKNILVCDDERHITRLLEQSLTRQGHSVTLAHGGDEAIRLLREDRFDMLVLDPKLAAPSTDEVLAVLKALPHAEKVEVVVMPKDG